MSNRQPPHHAQHPTPSAANTPESPVRSLRQGSPPYTDSSVPASQHRPQTQPHVDRHVERQPKRRGTVACRRCRRLRTKCVHQGGRPPCESCRKAGEGLARECSFPRRGEKDVDRGFRRRLREETVPEGYRRQETPPHGSAEEGAPGERENPHEERSGMGLDSELGTLCSGDGHAWDGHEQDEGAGEQSAQTTFTAVDGNTDHTSPLLVESAASPAPAAGLTPPSPPLSLPPHAEIIEGVKVFITSYFQLGFIPKAIFLERLAHFRSPSSSSAPSTFLLVSILSISARFTPSLVNRYGSPSAATQVFLTLASKMVPSELYTPTLSRTQSFFLLAISEFGHGLKDRSSMHMGIAVRMASILKLHREETYDLPADASPEDVVQMESARRTFWMIQSQENLHSGWGTPQPFAAKDVTALLPCGERDFAFGVHVKSWDRAALPGTEPAVRDGARVFVPGRSLFATLVQAHNLWGQVARRACRPEQQKQHQGRGGWGQEVGRMKPPWDPESEFATLTRMLKEWEDAMPVRHRWSVWNLRGWKAEGLHLAYLSVVMVLRLGNIVTRRVYLEDIIGIMGNDDDGRPRSFAAEGSISSGPGPTETGAAIPAPSALTPDTPNSHTHAIPANTASSCTHDPPPSHYLTLAHDLFTNVHTLHEQINAYVSTRSREEGFPAILVFCIYVCGSLASYLWRYPKLCPHLADKAEDMALGSLRVLDELQDAWPAAGRWRRGLRGLAMRRVGAPLGMDSGGEEASGQQRRSVERATAREQVANRAETGTGRSREDRVEGRSGGVGDDHNEWRGGYSSQRQKRREPSGGNAVPRRAFGDSNAQDGHQGQRQQERGAAPHMPDMNAFPNEWFDAELTAFLQGDVHYGLLDGWSQCLFG